ncbi:MAG: Beta-lactamase-like protein [Elusimicrobia bacterium]|nr:MAG: Beta-lactamase-like protein [Elusimicrobiota bacterium]KAF0155106.1 MAG: Beta-lactamase-like protein [Elusimicrobiota bacterium]
MMKNAARSKSLLHKPRFAILLSLLLLPLSGWTQLNVYFLNVGQGDATYIELPGGSNVLIDGGPSSLPVREFLMAKGVRRIDHVVLTHPHSDHYRGLKKVLQYFEVKNFYDTRVENLGAIGDNNLRELAAAQAAKVHFPEVGQHMNWDRNVTVKVLNTCSEVIQTRDSTRINNCSLVMRFYYNGTGLLLTGDIEASQENAITRVFKSGLESQILKVSHHGSAYSSTPRFLERVKPVHAIISYGVGNNYGHPHADALLRLQAAGATVYGTQDGNLLMTIPPPGSPKGIDVAPLPFAITPVSAEELASEPVTMPESQALEQLLNSPLR